MRIKQQLIFTTTAQTLNASEGGLSMIEIRTGGIGGIGCIAVTTGRQEVCGPATRKFSSLPRLIAPAATASRLGAVVVKKLLIQRDHKLP